MPHSEFPIWQPAEARRRAVSRRRQGENLGVCLTSSLNPTVQPLYSVPAPLSFVLLFRVRQYLVLGPLRLAVLEN